MTTAIEKLEERQRRASDPRISAWVSASAGAGKTTVLVRRILRLLLSEGVFPENILAITYTKAAAGEMASRINTMLMHWSTCGEKDLTESLCKTLGAMPTSQHRHRARRLFKKTLNLTGAIKIQTIHGFCQSLLRSFPFEANVTPGFRVIDNIVPIVRESKVQMLREPHIKKHLETIALEGTMRTFDEILEKIIAERSKFETFFAHHKTVKNAVKNLYTILGLTSNQTIQNVQKSYEKSFFEPEMRRIIQSHERMIAEQLKSTKSKTLEKRLEDIAASTSAKDWLLLEKTLFKKGGELKGASRFLKEQNAMILRPIQQMREKYQAEKIRVDIAEKTAAMLSIARDFTDKYARAKRKRNILDFDDILIKTKSLLEDTTIAPWILYKTDRGHAHILLDEAQDTSLIQWEVIRHLSLPSFDGSKDTHGTMFAVGDKKQSIYAFQGADPESFEQQKTRFLQQGQRPQQSFEHVRLNASFRSAGPILEWIDKTFCNAWQGICHHTIHHHYSSEIQLLPLLHKTSSSDRTNAVWAWEMASIIQHQIGKYLPCRDLHIKARDILVLVRSRTSFVRSLMRALKEKNIPVAGSDRMMLRDHIAVEDVCALLQFMLLPQDDLNLACVLKGPLIGLREQDIFLFAIDRGETCLWHSLQKYTRETNKFSTVVSYLEGWINGAGHLCPFETIDAILHTVCPLGVICNLQTNLYGHQAFEARLGIEAREILTDLLQVAITFEDTEIPTLQGFLHYVHTTPCETKRNNDQSQRNEVRIMTVHGAKGLQAPVVILPDCFKPLPQKPGFLWNSHNKICLWSGNKHTKTLEYDLARTTVNTTLFNTAQKQEEDRRLLYVAMSRAENILICGGKDAKGHKNTHSDSPCWYNYLRKGIEKLKIKGRTYTPYDKKNQEIWQKNAKKPQGGKVYHQATYLEKQLKRDRERNH